MKKLLPIVLLAITLAIVVVGLVLVLSDSPPNDEPGTGTPVLESPGTPPSETP